MNLGISLDRHFEEKFLQMRKDHPKFIKLNGLANEQLDPTRFFKNFLKSDNVANASIDDNSNVNNQAMPTLISESQKSLMKLLSYNKIHIEMRESFDLDTADEFFEKCMDGTVYLHDSVSTTFMPYCFAYSVKSIVDRGLYFINEMKADRAKHLDTYHSHILESVAFLTNIQSGAVGLVDFLVYSMKYWLDDVKNGYIAKENADIYRKQEFQKVIYALNQPYLKGGIQSAYTNFSVMDREYFIGLFGGESFFDDTFMVDYIEEFIEYQKSFLEFLKKEREVKSITYPVITASLIFKDNKFQDENFAKYIVKHNMKWADCNVYVSDNADTLSSCCRCNFDTNEIKKNKLDGHFNSIGGTDLNIGSSKVVTINLPRVAFLSKGDKKLAFDNIKNLVDNIQKFHFTHRKILQKNIDRGLLPNYSFGLMTMDNQFATVGVTGFEEYIDLMNGLTVNEINEKSYNEYGLNLASDTLEYINELGETTVDRYGYTQNVEQIPGESANIKLLDMDKLYYDNFPIQNKNIYSNQWCGLDSNFSLAERIRVSGTLDNLTGGGTILHLNLAEDWNSFDDAWNFNLNVAKSGVKYWSEIRKIHYCTNDHNFFSKTCPICGEEPIGDIVKIVGYLVKNEYFKSERKDELENRIFYNVDSIK